MVKSSDTFNDIMEKIKELKRNNDELVMELEEMKRQELYLRNEVKKRDFRIDELDKYNDDLIADNNYLITDNADQEKMIVNLETYNDDLVTGNLELNRELFKAQKEKDFYRQAYMKLFWKYTGMSD